MIKEFESILIHKNASLKDAMRQLDKTAERILFVVEESNILIGSLTDGDIRRWILRKGSIDGNVAEACFKDTFVAHKGYRIEEIKKEILKRKIDYVPVIDDKKRILEFLIWDRIFEKQIKRKPKAKLDIPVAIMAGGKGTRLDPFTKILPKPLIPIGDKTILELIIDKFREYQLDHFFISVNHKAKIIKSYFEEIEPEYKITFLYETKPLGTAGALHQIADKLKKPLLLTNCDIIIEADFADILKFHKDKKNDLTIVASLKNYNIPYGICEIENGGSLIQIKEKPEYNFLINTGMYILEPDVLKYIPKNEFYNMTDLIEKLKNLGKSVAVYPISENSWIDTGEWVEYKNAIDKFKL